MRKAACPSRRPLSRCLSVIVLALVLALPGLGSVPARAADPAHLQDWETDEAVAATTVSVPGHDAATRVRYPSHGESGLEFTVAPIGTPGAVANAGLTLTQDTPALPDNDWSGHDWLGWDFWMPEDWSAAGRITVRDDQGVAWGGDWTIRGMGWTAVEIPLTELTEAGLDLSDIRYVNISIPRRSEPVKGYFDSVRVGDGHADHSAYGDQVVQNLVEQVDFGSILDRVDDELDSARDALGEPGTPSYEPMKAWIDRLADTATRVRDGLDDIDGVEAYEVMLAELAELRAAPERLDQILQLRKRQPVGLFGLDTADSMSLVHPKDLAWDSTGTDPRLEMARGEAEHLQAVVAPYGMDLSRLSLRIGRISAADGSEVDEGLTAQVAPIGSLHTTPSGAYGRETYVGWTPDPIRDDLTEVDVPAGDVQPWLVSLETAQDVAPGTYTVVVIASVEGERDRRLSIDVTVWDTVIDETSELKTSFQFTPWLLNDLYGLESEDERREMTVKYWDFLAEHRIQPDQIYTVDGDPTPKPPADKFVPQPVERITWIRDHYGLTQFTAMYLWHGLLDPDEPETWDAQIDVWLDQMETAMAEYEEAGVADKAVVYGFDEATGPILEAARHTFARFKERFPEVPIMTTLRDDSMGVDTDLAGLVDIWVPWIDGYQQDVAEQTRARGDEAWWYHAISTRYPQPNWFNGYPPIDSRMLMGPMSHQAGVEGILYYATNRWLVSDRGDQLLVDDEILSDWNPETYFGTAGDGSLFYPGAEGPMSSLRLENVRDGLEDHSLMQELRRAIDSHPDAPRGLLARAEKLLGATDIVTDSRNFTEDPDEYRSWRREVGRTLGLLAKF